MLHPLRRLFGVSGKHGSPPLVTGIDRWSPQLSIKKAKPVGAGWSPPIRGLPQSRRAMGKAAAQSPAITQNPCGPITL